MRRTVKFKLNSVGYQLLPGGLHALNSMQTVFLRCKRLKLRRVNAKALNLQTANKFDF